MNSGAIELRKNREEKSADLSWGDDFEDAPQDSTKSDCIPPPDAQSSSKPESSFDVSKTSETPLDLSVKAGADDADWIEFSASASHVAASSSSDTAILSPNPAEATTETVNEDDDDDWLSWK